MSTQKSHHPGVLHFHPSCDAFIPLLSSENSNELNLLTHTHDWIKDTDIIGEKVVQMCILFKI